jgi:hypothetical protein
MKRTIWFQILAGLVLAIGMSAHGDPVEAPGRSGTGDGAKGGNCKVHPSRPECQFQYKSSTQTLRGPTYSERVMSAIYSATGLEASIGLRFGHLFGQNPPYEQLITACDKLYTELIRTFPEKDLNPFISYERERVEVANRCSAQDMIDRRYGCGDYYYKKCRRRHVCDGSLFGWLDVNGKKLSKLRGHKENFSDEMLRVHVDIMRGTCGVWSEAHLVEIVIGSPNR